MTDPAHAEKLLLDRYLPHFDTTIAEHVIVPADQQTTWEALSQLDLMRVHTPLMDAAMRVRGLPSAIAGALGRDQPAPPPPPPSELKLRGGDPELPGWLSLGEIEQCEIAIGAIGRFWQPDIDWYDVGGMSPDDFAAFDEPGWGRIAASFSIREYGTASTLATYEARTATPDPGSARSFRRYWVVVRPFVAHIMRASLETLRDDARQLHEPTDEAASERDRA